MSSQDGASIAASTFDTLPESPLGGMSTQDIIDDVDYLLLTHDLRDHRCLFIKGALVAARQDPADGQIRDDGDNNIRLSDVERRVIALEYEHPVRSLAASQWLQTGLCALCAVVQGMHLTVTNGAQDFYFAYFDMQDPLLRGFVNSAPFISAALLGCWLNQPLNHVFGRRGTIFVSCIVSLATSFWQAAADTWVNLAVARVVLGLAVGASSATTPVYAAECAPPSVRGRLTMLWQMFTAFGIMVGYAASMAFQDVKTWGENTQWRWMMGVTAIPALIVCFVVFLVPESPRYCLDKGDFVGALHSLVQLRCHHVLAFRDLYLAHKHIDGAKHSQGSGRWSTLRELFKPRNLRAAQASWFLMFMQQFCGVNVIAYYSTHIFMGAGFTRSESLAVSLGCGVANFVGAIPALYTIDRFGRRSLLLSTFPVLAISLFWTGASFYIVDQDARLASICTGIYVFMLFYSPGMGPVPFTYSAEAFSLSVRPLGMASATAVTWAFNFIINFTWPKMMLAMTPAGGFCFYAAWNVFAWFFAFFLLPETKGYSLEQLDHIFSKSNRQHAREQWGGMKRFGAKDHRSRRGPFIQREAIR
ncbi:Sugar (and other) transporter [Geosmithia morbida]|uniref:Sugar (And other) transporter n=1 Tax=Geosmithia morbida TaxID=1094350 RepID=A0A9P5D2S0_9HYPO|nr:Sugar (and other) transporter [Geosmithia morbida]KAF4125388.1 Sugar (and other) transporter [Geosmithia morbida]